MKHSALMESMEQWSPEQLLAIVDFCQMLSDSIWLHHDQRLIDYLQSQQITPRIRWPDKAVAITPLSHVDDYLDD